MPQSLPPAPNGDCIPPSNPLADWIPPQGGNDVMDANPLS